MFRNLCCWLALAWMLCTPSVQADQILTVTRVDSRENAKPFYTVGIVSLNNGLELWVFGVDSPVDIEAGKLWLVHKSHHVSVFGGGYLVYWPKSRDWFVLPWVSATATHKHLLFDASLAYYQPLTGGPEILFTNEIFAGYRANKTVTAGIGLSFWDEQGFSTISRVGPSLRLQISPTTDLAVRYLLRGGDNTFRFQVNQKF